MDVSVKVLVEDPSVHCSGDNGINAMASKDTRDAHPSQVRSKEIKGLY